MPLSLDENIRAYESMKAQLKADKERRWVVFFDGVLRGDFATDSEAIAFAARNWGRGPYLIRQVGRPPFIAPSSIRHWRVYADC